MKKILFLFFVSLNLFALKMSLNAQTCEGVSVDVFEPIQSGAHNYFGVRVTLSQVYNQNVTVSGYIHAGSDEWNNQDHPFTLTVTTGDLTAGTASNFYETSPTGDAAVTVSSISPCPNWNTGNNGPSNPNNPYDYVGQDHNDGLDYALANLQVPVGSADDIISDIQGYFSSISSSFSVSAFLDSSQQLAADLENASDFCNIFSGKGFSNQFCNYYNVINGLLEAASTPEDFYSSMRSLEEEINASSIDATEKGILLSSASVYRYSAYYWSTSTSTNAWEEKLNTMPIASLYDTKENTNGLTIPISVYGEENVNGLNSIPFCIPVLNNIPKKFFFSWKVVGKADAAGAISGGVAGAITGGTATLGALTVPAYVAGAVSWGLGSSVAAVIGSLFHWW
jgi:hypothetical protein